MQMTGGEAVVNALIKQGVKTLFGLPGVQNDWLYNALYDRREQIEVIHTRHEQGAGYMALGYAQATGDAAVFSVVPGPGFLNASAALATAQSLNASVLCLSGQIPSGKIGQGTGALHEIPDQMSIMRQLTKWAARVKRPAEAPALVAEAFRQMRTGLPQPVGLEVPMDVLAQKEDVEPIGAIPDVQQLALDMEQIEQAAVWLGQAQRPLIYVGGGAQNASAEVRELAELLEAPVVAYRTGQGVMDGRHYLSIHHVPSRELWQTADVVLAIGTNMRDPLTWGVDEALKIIRIDADPASHGRIHLPDLAITARAEEAVPALLELVGRHNHKRDSRQEEMLALKGAWQKQTAYLEPQLSYLKVMRETMGEAGIFVEELTQVGFTSRLTMPVYHPRTYISTGYQGTLGFGFPTALGVKVAKPDAPVISVTGDGGFMFAVQELATAVQHRIGLVTVLFNNNQFGNVQQMQKNLYDNRVIATDLHNPDFVKLAESFGAQGLRAETPAQLQQALERGFTAEGPTLIEVPIGDVPSVDRFRRLPRVRPLGGQ